MRPKSAILTYMPRPGRCSDKGRLRKKRPGRAPGRPCEPFRAIQGAHATEADPNESHVSFFVGLHFFLIFCPLGWRGGGSDPKNGKGSNLGEKLAQLPGAPVSVAWAAWIALKGSLGRPGARPDRK